MRGILPVDKFRQRLAKGFNARLAGVFDRKVKPRGGGHSFYVVTVAAACLFQNGVDFFGKRNLLAGKLQSAGAEEQYEPESTQVHPPNSNRT